MTDSRTGDGPRKRYSTRRLLSRRGLRWTLVVWFLALSLLPLAIVSIVSYQTARDSLYAGALTSLEAVTRVKARHIDSYFSRVLDDLEFEAENGQNILLVQKLQTAFEESGKPLVDFVQSPPWQTIVDQWTSRAPSLLNMHGYYDYFLMDRDGNILYTVARESDLGTNVFQGKYSETLFAAACRRAYETGRPAFSDYDFYAPSHSEVAGFLVTPLVDEDGERVGLIAFQIPIDRINTIMRESGGPGQTGETYLIGADLTTRSDPRRLDGSSILTQRIDTKLSRDWLEQRGASESGAVRSNDAASVYRDYRGVPVIGAYENLEVAGVSFGVIGEMNASEALAPVQRLRRTMWWLIIATGLVVVTVAIVIARRITRPLFELLRATGRIATGQFDEPVQVASSNEIGALAAAMNSMSHQLRRRIRLTDALNRVLRESITCETEEDLAEISLRMAEELTGSAFGFIGEVNREETFDTIAISNPGWDACRVPHSVATKMLRGMVIRGIWATVLKDGESHIVNDPASHSERVGTPEGHPPLSCFLGVPLKRGSRTLGMIALANKQGGYSHDDQEAIQALAFSFYEALSRKRLDNALARMNWVQVGVALLSAAMIGQKDIGTLCRDIITCLADYLGASIGAIFLVDEAQQLEIAGRYAYTKNENAPDRFAFGEGLVGQAAVDGKMALISDVPDDYITVGSGLGQTRPRNILVIPFSFENQVLGTIELGTLDEFSEQHKELLNRAAQSIAIAIDAAQSRERQKVLLEETQSQADKLQIQEEELRAANEGLERRAEQLWSSQEELQTQQEELRVTNEELEQSNQLLTCQKREVELTRKRTEERARDLVLANKYKSEFLANMSHELRTPLNSLLLLAESLAQNREANLTEEQVECATIIHGAGNDLLNLINEILDLSKIEAGRMDVRIGAVSVSGLADSIRTSFAHLAEEAGLGLDITICPDAPAEISSDQKRVKQIIGNLVSNAIKFTEAGSVTVRFARPAAGTDLSKSGLAPDECLAVVISDTGIGVAADKQEIVFQAFQQADGGTSRLYGGAGLGLSISRELAHLLGGEIQLESQPKRGSTFSLYLPVGPEPVASTGGTQKELDHGAPPEETALPVARPRSYVPDDRDSPTGREAVILVIEDDPTFAKVLRDICHDRGLQCLVAPNGQAGLELAAEHLPAAIVLDIHLPGMDGWAVLDALKENTLTRHIPVHIVSVEEATTKAIQKGAVGHISKPLDREDLDEIFRRLERATGGTQQRVLVVEDDSSVRRSIVEMTEDQTVKVDEAGTAAEALEAIRSVKYCCVVLDLGLPDMDGKELLARLERENTELPPVIVYTARDLTSDEETMIREHAESIVIKDVRSQERLLDEVSLFLHRVVSQMPETKQKIIQSLHDADGLLRDKKVLVVDDDMRTSFAVSRLLSQRGMKPLRAENGARALRMLDQQRDIALVLMDVMMPRMDGYETIQRIRGQNGEKQLPIIALTAKAMPEDREKCLAAGANDYMSKPVDEERLVSMMRVWLHS